MTDDGMVSPSQYDDARDSRPSSRPSQRSRTPAKRNEVGPAAAAPVVTPVFTNVTPTADEAGALASVIALDIIPRLLMGHRLEEQANAPVRPRGRFTDLDRASFLSDALNLSAPQLSAKLREMMMWGHDLDGVLLDLMAPVARTLGEMWERDSITFIDVTIAVQRMQQVLRDICQSTTSDAYGPHALLLPAPGETHSFGLVIVSELFRKRGWFVAGGLPVSRRELVNMVQCQPYAIVGFSLSNDALLGELKDAIRNVRKSSVFRNVMVVVGGRVFDGRPHLAGEIGADAAFADAAEVIAFADKVAANVAETTASRAVT
jgi:MerR family transcriptional regulator, light-induced transcriptional regulator